MAAGDLTTLDAVRAHVKGTVGVPATDEALLESLISAVSAMFVQEAGTSVLTEAHTELRNGNGRATLFLGHYPVTEIVSVEVDGEVIPERAAVGEPGWVLASADTGRLDLVGYTFTEGTGNVVVQYLAGYGATAPADVSQAVVDQVAYLYRMKDRIGIANESQNGTSTTYLGAWVAQQGGGGKTPLYLATVARYRRVA